MITITPTAEGKIRELMQEEKDTVGLRVYVKGGGCHGYQYGMSFESMMTLTSPFSMTVSSSLMADSKLIPYW